MEVGWRAGSGRMETSVSATDPAATDNYVRRRAGTNKSIRRRPPVEEIFMGDAQQNSDSARTFTTHTWQSNSQGRCIKVYDFHLSADDKIIVSFPYHGEALRAIELGGREHILCIKVELWNKQYLCTAH